MTDQPGAPASGRRVDWTINVPVLMGIIGAVVTIALGFLSVRDGLIDAIAKIDRKADAIEAQNKTENMLQNQRLDALDRIMDRARTEDAARWSDTQRLLTALSGDLANVRADVRVIAAGKPEPHRR